MIFRIRGAREIMIAFFCYSAVEQTCGLWASSFLNLSKGIPAEQAASFAAMFFIGITTGRAVSGFLSMRMSDQDMIRLGQVLILSGIALLLLPAGDTMVLLALILIGLGCAPIYIRRRSWLITSKMSMRYCAMKSDLQKSPPSST